MRKLINLGCFYLQIQQHHLVAITVHVSMRHCRASCSGDKNKKKSPTNWISIIFYLPNGLLCNLFSSGAKTTTLHR